MLNTVRYFVHYIVKPHLISEIDVGPWSYVVSAFATKRKTHLLAHGSIQGKIPLYLNFWILKLFPPF